MFACHCPFFTKKNNFFFKFDDDIFIVCENSLVATFFKGNCELIGLYEISLGNHRGDTSNIYRQKTSPSGTQAL